MTLEEKLRFLADRIDDGKEFYVTTYGKDGCKSEWKYDEFSYNFYFSDLDDMTFELLPQWEFTEDEKTILRNLPEQYNWIARDDDDETMGELYIYAFKPSKFNDTWIFDKGSVTDLDNFKHLFQSIQWSNDEPCEFRRYL